MIGDLTLRLTSSKWELPVKEPINRASNLSFHVSLSGTLVSIQDIFEHLAQNKPIHYSSKYCWGLCQYGLLELDIEYPIRKKGFP